MAARDFDSERFAAELRDATHRLLEQLDPAALPDAEPAWNSLVGDIAAAAAWEQARKSPDQRSGLGAGRR